jgi:hypothetical protein
MPVRLGGIMRKLVLTTAVALACLPRASQAGDEGSSEIVAAAAQFSGKTNCREGDVATISGMRSKELPEAVARYCDFWGQIVVLPDVGETDAARQIVLCKCHQREARRSPVLRLAASVRAGRWKAGTKVIRGSYPTKG